jgi:hypothetical protein
MKPYLGPYYLVRNGVAYSAWSTVNGELAALVNLKTGNTIPKDTTTFRRLADGNRGNRFKQAGFSVSCK